MADTAGRAQDQGRRHRRRGAPSAETATLLARYQSAMRAELTGLLDELEAVEAPGLGMTEPTPKVNGSAERGKRWELAIRLARELGTEVDPTTPADPADDRPVPSRPARARRVKYE